MIDYISVPTLRDICADECAKCREGQAQKDDSLCLQCVLFDVMMAIKEKLKQPPKEEQT